MCAQPAPSPADLPASGGQSAAREHGLPPLSFFVKALAIDLFVAALPAWLVVRFSSTTTGAAAVSAVHAAVFADAFLLLCLLWAWFLWTQRDGGLGATRREKRFSALLVLCCAAAWAPVVWMLAERELILSRHARIVLACIALVALPCVMRLARAARSDLVAWREGRTVPFLEGCRRWALIAVVPCLLVVLPKTYYRACERMRTTVEAAVQPADSEAEAQAIKRLLHDAARLGGPGLSEAYLGLCEVGDAESVPLLIAGLEGVPAERLNLEPWRHCRLALRIITNQHDPRTHQEWAAWYARNGARPHLAWIADGFAARGVPVSREGDAAGMRALLRIAGRTMRAAVSGSDEQFVPGGAWIDWSRRRPRLLLSGMREDHPGEAYNAYLLCKSHTVPAAKDVVAELAQSEAPEERMGAAVFAACERSPAFDEILAALRKDPDCAVRWYAAANVLRRERAVWNEPRNPRVTEDALPVTVGPWNATIDGGILYLVHMTIAVEDDVLTAYDAVTLTRQWSVFGRPDILWVPMAVDSAHLFAWSADGRLVCLARENGCEIWTADLGLSAVDLEGRLRRALFPCGDHVIAQGGKDAEVPSFYVCRIADGSVTGVGQGNLLAAEDSTAIVADAQGVRCVAIPSLTASPPLPVEGRTCLARLHGGIAALLVVRSASDEAPYPPYQDADLWIEGWSTAAPARVYATRLALRAPIIESSAEAEGILYLSGGGSTWAVRLADGAVLWESSTGGRVFLAEKSVLVGTDVRVVALDRDHGYVTALWTLPDELWGWSGYDWVAHLAGDRLLLFYENSRRIVDLGTR
ncbi:MAG TPA: hypothetical protein DCM87_04710 [Planctomycetes bacterium]|nr:hypothetical protein [Planctomycetota bacterium]